MTTSQSRTLWGYEVSEFRLWAFYFLISAIVLIGYLIDGYSTVRHFSILLLLVFAGSKSGITFKKGQFMFGLVSILFYAIIISLHSPSLYTLKTAALIFSPFVAASLLSSSAKTNIHQFIKTFFIVAVIFQVIALATSESSIVDLGAFQLLSAATSSDILLSTNSDIESSLGMIFGYLGLYFLTTKKYRYFTFCFMLFLLNYKRIVLVGFVLSAGYYLIISIRKSRSLPLKTWLYAAPFILLTLLLAISSGELNELVTDITGRGMNHITTGRYAIHNEIFETLFIYPQIFFGYGIGQTHQMVASFSFTHMTLVHSDYLMLLYDIGIIGFSFFFVLLK